MKQALPLRPYQREALDAVRAAVHKRVAVVLPTGGGKTVCFAHQALEWLRDHPEDRVLVLVHREELAEQARRKLLDVAPHLSVGIVKGARNEVRADVIVASVMTVKNAKRLAQLRGIGLIIVDECHHAAAQSYVDVLNAFPDATVVGWTATLSRADSKSLGLIWKDVAFSRDISWMIRRKYLVNVRGLAIEVPDLNLAGVKSTRSDFREGELGEALAESLAPQKVADAVREHAADRKVLAFFPTVASCYVFAEAFEAAGISAYVVHGGMTSDERADVMAKHRRGTVLVNCMLLTEGYDDPEVDCIVVGRPTKSKPLYIQIVGRGLRVDLERPWDQQDCLLLDVVGANAMHDLRSIVDLSEKPLKPAVQGCTLTELEDEFDAGEGVPDDEVAWYTGETVVREFNPLGQASTRVWLKTRGGVYFLPAGKTGYVFIMQYPVPGQWSVAWCGQQPADRPMRGDDRPVGMTEHRGLPLDQALVWAEDLAVDLGATLNTATRTAPWRRKPVSEKMAAYAARLGLRVGEDERQGALSDRIDQVNGSMRIDPLVRAVRERKS